MLVGGLPADMPPELDRPPIPDIPVPPAAPPVSRFPVPDIPEPPSIPPELPDMPGLCPMLDMPD